jgi:hypothetical protein
MPSCHEENNFAMTVYEDTCIIIIFQLVGKSYSFMGNGHIQTMLRGERGPSRRNLG